MRKTGRRLLPLLALGLASAMAYGHSMYESAVMLDIYSRDIRAEVQLPLERISVAFGEAINSETLNRDRASLTAYILTRLHARALDGRSFQVLLESPLRIENVDRAPYIVARTLFQPPTSLALDAFEIEDDVLLDRIPSQVTLVSIRSDWGTSVFANDPQLVGVLRGKMRSLTIDRTDRSWSRGFSSIFRLGIRHIAEGTDHLLFLLALLLPAPLLVGAGRWAGFAGVRPCLLKILKVVTAFTVGHSVTLALAALGLVRVPSRPIEVLIAVSILVSAIHALRPLFSGREAAIAGFFGLVHGLAFATTLGELGLGRWERVASILAFNLGIEAMQLIVIAATMPSLVLLSRTRIYSSFRVGGALFAGSASLCWIAERLFNKHTSIDVVVDSVAHHSGWIALCLFFIGVTMWWRQSETDVLPPMPDRVT